METPMPKLNVREYCTQCGQLAAWKDGNRIKGWHKCPNAPLGPPIPPMNFHISEVNFIPAEDAELTK
jgi:hypothetical protein